MVYKKDVTKSEVIAQAAFFAFVRDHADRNKTWYDTVFSEPIDTTTPRFIRRIHFATWEMRKGVYSQMITVCLRRDYKQDSWYPIKLIKTDRTEFSTVAFSYRPEMDRLNRLYFVPENTGVREMTRLIDLDNIEFELALRRLPLTRATPVFPY